MPQGHRGARDSLLVERHRAGGTRGPARADRRARQLPARAGQAPRRHLRRGCGAAQHSDRDSAGLRARRQPASAPALLPRRPGRSGASHRRRLGAREGQSLIRGLPLLLVVVAATAAPALAQDEKLQALRGRIEALSTEMQRSESARREARDALRDSERAISETNRTLAALQAEGVRLRRESSRIAERRRTLERSLTERQAAVERMLAARQAAGAPDALRVALSGDDPGSLSRTLYYVGHVSRAAAAALASYRAGLDEQARLARDAQAKRERLKLVEQSSRADRERILKERRERKRVFDRLAGDIRKSRREINVLRADEARLARLVEGLGRLLGRVELVPEKDAGKDPFSALRGKLRLPVRGELSGRFGAPRGAALTEA